MKNKRIYTESTLFMMLVLLLTGCLGDTSLNPTELGQYEKVFMDITFANAAAESHPIIVRDSLRTEYYKQVFQLHNISQKEYEKLTERLEVNPRQASEVYVRVLDSLKMMKEEYDKAEQDHE